MKKVELENLLKMAATKGKRKTVLTDNDDFYAVVYDYSIRNTGYVKYTMLSDGNERLYVFYIHPFNRDDAWVYDSDNTADNIVVPQYIRTALENIVFAGEV